ncbi:unnamed protein product [Leptidea sinapis]|uniref:Protein phosphatase 1 regulatory subunit 14C n=1 Tax=Leptidea sinapis TaxID=189913 RepID=A0A5E4QJM4_9NEOP|nr:unnamed protein product [Leptidea sinapis]
MSLFFKFRSVKERREKFLTAKYGSHQMALIRKRLAVEMWLYDELQKFDNSESESVQPPAKKAKSHYDTIPSHQFSMLFVTNV